LHNLITASYFYFCRQQSNKNFTMSHCVPLKRLIDKKKILKPSIATAQESMIKRNGNIYLKIDFLY